MKHLFFIPLACLVMGLAWAGPLEDARRYYEDALRSFNEEEYKAATIQLKNALQLIPNNLPARILLGKALLRVGNGAAAEKEIRLAQKLGADPSLTLLPLAKALNQQKKYAEVVEQIPEYGLPYDLQVEIRFQRGNAYLGMRQLTKAQEEFQSALRAQSDAVLPTIGLAMVALKQGKFEEAEKLAEKAVGVDPNNAEAWYAKGTIAYGQGDLVQAIVHYNRALEVLPTHYIARMSLATCYLDARRYPEAVSELRMLREQTEWDPQVSYLLSVALKKTGDLGASKEALDRAASLINAIGYEVLKKDPPKLLLAGLINYSNRELESAYKFLTGYLQFDGNNPIALKLQGSTLLAMNKPQSAVRAFKLALEMAPESVELLNLLGDAYLRLGNYIQAIGAYQEAERLLPGQPELLHKLGISHLAVSNRKAAIEELEVALKNNPDVAITAMVLSAIHLSVGDVNRAQEIAEDLVRREHRNPTAINLLATVYLGGGKRDLAREWYEKALVIDPTFRPARINLAKIDLQEGLVTEARQALDLLLKEEPENLVVMVELAKLEKSQGDIDKALKILEKAHTIDRHALTPALRLIDLYIEQGDPLPAVKTAEEMKLEHTDNPTVLEALGRSQLAAGKPAAASVAFKRVVSIVGYNSERLYRIAQLQLRAGAVDDARWSLVKAVDGDPEFLPAQFALIDLQIQTGRLKDAAKLIGDLGQRHSGHPAVSGLTGDLAMRRGEYATAVLSYRQALEQLNNSTAAIRLFRAQTAAGERIQAEEDLIKWVDAHPGALAAKRLLAEVHHRAGRLDQARNHYEEIFSMRQDDASLLNNLANLYIDLGDPRSLEFALRAHELAPSSASVTDTLGWLLVKVGQTEKGLGYLRDAAARDTASPEIRYHLAVALQDLRRHDEALWELQVALKNESAFSGRADAERRLEILGAASAE